MKHNTFQQVCEIKKNTGMSAHQKREDQTKENAPES